MIETIEKIKTTDGTLFDSSKFGPEKAKKYDASYLRVKAASDKLGKDPEYQTCIRITREALDNAIQVFKEECELWLPEATKKHFEAERNFHFHEGIIGRYLSDGDKLPRNLYQLCNVLCSINTSTLLRYDQIWSKNNPEGIKIEGE